MPETHTKYQVPEQEMITQPPTHTPHALYTLSDYISPEKSTPSTCTPTIEVHMCIRMQHKIDYHQHHNSTFTRKHHDYQVKYSTMTTKLSTEALNNIVNYQTKNIATERRRNYLNHNQIYHQRSITVPLQGSYTSTNVGYMITCD